MDRYERIVQLYARERRFKTVGDYYSFLRGLSKEEIEKEIQDFCQFDFDCRMGEGIDGHDEKEVEESVYIEKAFRRHLKNIIKEEKQMDFIVENANNIPEKEQEEEKKEVMNEVELTEECEHDWLDIKEDAQFKYVVCKKCLLIRVNPKVKNES